MQSWFVASAASDCQPGNTVDSSGVLSTTISTGSRLAVAGSGSKNVFWPGAKNRVHGYSACYHRSQLQTNPLQLRHTCASLGRSLKTCLQIIHIRGVVAGSGGATPAGAGRHSSPVYVAFE